MKCIAPIAAGFIKLGLTFSTRPSRPGSQIPFLLFCVNVPYDVIRQPNDLIPCPLCHFGKSFCLRLILERIAREIDACEYISHAFEVLLVL